MIKSTILILLGSIAMAVPAAFAGSIPQSNLVQLCVAAKQANDMGISVKPLLQQSLGSRALANVAMNEMKPKCPKAY